MFNWSPAESDEFTKLKMLVASDRILKFYDPNRETRISCDASMKGLGAILEQGVDASSVCFENTENVSQDMPRLNDRP